MVWLDPLSVRLAKLKPATLAALTTFPNALTVFMAVTPAELLAVNAPVRVLAPVTASVPATSVLPLADATVNLLVATATSPDGDSASQVSVPPATAKVFAECVSVTSPLLKLTTAPEARNKSDHMTVAEPSGAPSDDAGVTSASKV